MNLRRAAVALGAWLLVSSGEAAEPIVAPKAKARSEGESSLQVVPRHFLHEGGRRIESGLRVETSGDRVRVSRRVFRQGGEPQGITLPEHMGGGFLFYQPLAVEGSSSTAFYRASSWTADLEPVGRIPFAVRHVAVGFDRIYAMGVSLQVAFDLDSGEVKSLDPLPPLPTLTGVAFDGPRRGLVSGPLVGVLYSADAGLTWAPVEGAESIEIDLDGARLFVRTGEGLALVDEAGQAVPVNKLGGDRSELRTVDYERFVSGQVTSQAFGGGKERVSSSAADFRDRLERKWLSTLTRGAPHSGFAWAIDGGKLTRLALGEELELVSFSTPVSPTATCLSTIDPEDEKALPLFVCRDQTTTSVHELSQSKALESQEGVLRQIWQVAGRAPVLTWGAGGVLFAGDCRGRAQEGVACRVSSRGSRALALPKAIRSSGAPLSFATSGERSAAIWFERKAGKLKSAELLSPREAPKKLRSWSLPSDHSIAEFLRDGTLLPRATFTEEGLAFWATHREKFVGILLGDGEKPSFGAVQRPLRRALFDGRRAMLWGAAGFAKQTTDGGQTFEELSLPYRSGDPELAAVDHPGDSITMGCSPVGCALGRLLRLGWGLPKETEEAIPTIRPFVVPGPGRFRFTCSGERSSPSRSLSGEASFPDFWEQRAPSLSGGNEGSSVGFPGDAARLYAWGPADVAWSRAGRAQAVFFDPWDGGGIKSTSPTLQLFSSTLDAQSRMGLIDRSSGFRFAAMDPDGDGGVMLLRGGPGVELLAFEEGKPLERFAGVEELGLRTLAGAVRSQGTFVAAFIRGPMLSLVRLSGGVTHPLAEFNLGNQGTRGVKLVRTERGDLGLAIDGDAGLFVYPVSDEGDLGEPVVVPFTSHKPPACSPESSGFIVDQELSVAPYLDTPSGSSLPVSQVRAKMIVGYGRVCIDALRGQARGLPDFREERSTAATIPFSVIDSDSDGRRFQLTCE